MASVGISSASGALSGPASPAASASESPAVGQAGGAPASAAAGGSVSSAGASAVVKVSPTAALAGQPGSASQGASEQHDADQAKAAPAYAIGTQMVLVFDDQTRTMTVRMLDIETQKVDADLAPQLNAGAGSGSSNGAPVLAAGSPAQPAASPTGLPAAGTLVSTKA